MSLTINTLPIRIPDIVLPNTSINLQTWSTIACDQFTSNPAYWDSVKNIVRNSPSTLHITLPEIYLEDAEVAAQYLKNIKQHMQQYRQDGIFDLHENCLLLIRRTTKDAGVRSGLMVQVDLAQYDPNPQSSAPIRATEAIVPARLTKRIEVRKNTSMDFSHVIMLYEDVENALISQIAQHACSTAYETDLMLEGGHIRADVCDAQKSLGVFSHYFESMRRKLAEQGNSALFVIGDGNHSLMAAKQAWLDMGANMQHPDRWALVELVNVHDTGLHVFPIHRVLYKASCEDLFKILQTFGTLKPHDKGHSAEEHGAVLIIHRGLEQLWIPHDTQQLSIEALETILEKHSNLYEAVDFIHDEAEVQSHASENSMDTPGFILPSFERAALFRYVHEHRLFPRKSFALGHSIEKRYYIEACDRSVSDGDIL